MTDRAIGRHFALRVTVDAETHVDFVNRNHAVHRLHIAMTFLARDPGIDVRLMREANEVRERVHPVPSDLEGRLLLFGPWTRDGLNPAHQAGAMTSDTSRDRRCAGGLRSSCILMTVLAGNFVDAGVDAMTKRNRLFDIAARRPWPLRERQGRESEDQ
jgi:hypothetical protein